MACSEKSPKYNFSSKSSFPQLTNIPTLYVETVHHKYIKTKDEYVDCKIILVKDGQAITYEEASIRGRGNTTWNIPEKKPYKLKFKQPVAILGEDYATDSRWTLLANAFDKSMLRNALTYQLGRFMGLEYNPASTFVDFYLNGDYEGTYLLSDQCNINEKRINVDKKTGWVLEYNYSENNTEPPHFPYYNVKNEQIGWIDIKNPEGKMLTQDTESDIQHWFEEFNRRLYSSDFTSATKGYRYMIDENSLIDWYVASEITCDIDMLHTMKMYRDIDGKMKFGPLWDKDIAYNNSGRINLIKTLIGQLNSLDERPMSSVFQRMWKDPWFRNAVSKRFEELDRKGLELYMVSAVDSLANVINASQKLNYTIAEWSISDWQQGGEHQYERDFNQTNYAAYVELLKSHVHDRIAFLRAHL